MAKSYFAILGVSSSASPEEIRSAYRRLAKEYHPDHFEGGSGPFREIQEAYSVVGDEHRRSRYKQSLTSDRSIRPSGRSFYPEPEPLIPEPSPVDLGGISPVGSFQSARPSFDVISEWFADNFFSMNRPKSGRVQELTLEVPLTREQARRGGTAQVTVPGRAVCPICLGTGGFDYYACARCAGEGRIPGETPVSIAFPPGLESDHAVLVPLDWLGVRNLHLTVLFRPTHGDY